MVIAGPQNEERIGREFKAAVGAQGLGFLKIKVGVEGQVQLDRRDEGGLESAAQKVYFSPGLDLCVQVFSRVV